MWTVFEHMSFLSNRREHEIRAAERVRPLSSED